MLAQSLPKPIFSLSLFRALFSVITFVWAFVLTTKITVYHTVSGALIVCMTYSVLVCKVAGIYRFFHPFVYTITWQVAVEAIDSSHLVCQYTACNRSWQCNMHLMYLGNIDLFSMQMSKVHSHYGSSKCCQLLYPWSYSLTEQHEPKTVNWHSCVQCSIV